MTYFPLYLKLRLRQLAIATWLLQDCLSKMGTDTQARSATCLLISYRQCLLLRLGIFQERNYNSELGYIQVSLPPALERLAPYVTHSSNQHLYSAFILSNRYSGIWIRLTLIFCFHLKCILLSMFFDPRQYSKIKKLRTGRVNFAFVAIGFRRKWSLPSWLHEKSNPGSSNGGQTMTSPKVFGWSVKQLKTRQWKKDNKQTKQNKYTLYRL